MFYTLYLFEGGGGGGLKFIPPHKFSIWRRKPNRNYVSYQWIISELSSFIQQISWITAHTWFFMTHQILFMRGSPGCGSSMERGVSIDKTSRYIIQPLLLISNYKHWFLPHNWIISITSVEEHKSRKKKLNKNPLPGSPVYPLPPHKSSLLGNSQPRRVMDFIFNFLLFFIAELEDNDNQTPVIFLAMRNGTISVLKNVGLIAA